MKTFADFDIDVRGKSSGQVKTKCPSCKHDRKHKTDDPLSVNITEGVWNCHNCGYAGTLKEHEQRDRQYHRPPRITTPAGSKIEAWFASRKINANTIKHFGLSEKREWMPQTQKEENCIAFPYIKNGEPVNYKFRDGAKNFKMVKEAELVIFNYDGVRGKKIAIITEGEIDAMSVFEAGVCMDEEVGVCSVPNGASKGNQKLEYLDHSWVAFSTCEKIILATDDDEPGRALKAELARRLGRHRCFDIVYPEGCKDLNEVLIKKGGTGVSECLNSSKPLPVDGIVFLSDFEAEIDHVFEHGIPEGATIGFEDFDRLYKFAGGRLSVWTGVPGSGKSTFLDQVLIRLANRHDWKHGVCSFEKPYVMHFQTLASCYIGKPFAHKDYTVRMTRAEKDKAKDFYRNRFYWFKMMDEDLTADGIISKATHLVLAYGILGLVIDPYNYIENARKTTQTESEYISELLGKLCTFARNYDVHIFLVAHPVKMPKKADGEMEVPTLYNIAGSQNFYSKPDMGVAVARNRSTGLVTVYVQKVRFEPTEGKLGYCDFHYDPPTYRYRQDSEPNFAVEHLWKSTPVQQDMFKPEDPGKGIHPPAVIAPRLVDGPADFTTDSDSYLPF